MEVQDRLARSRGRLESAGVDVSLSLLHRAGPRPPVVFLHGFGSTRRAVAGPPTLFAAGLHHKVHAAAVRGVFESMVDLSDHGDLMETFLHWPMYSNPVATWRAVARFADRADAGGERW